MLLNCQHSACGVLRKANCVLPDYSYIHSMNQNLENWHNIVENRDWEALQAIMAENVEFHSPFVWKPKTGAPTVAFIVKSAAETFENFAYHREWVDGNNLALEFSATIGDKSLKGIDLIRFNDAGKIEHFEVMVRPGNSLMVLGQQMTMKLAAGGIG